MSRAEIAAVESFTFSSSKIAPDKSISHRAVIFSMLARGTSEITNFLRAEDTMNSLSIVKNLGAKVEDDGKTIKISADKICESATVLNCGNSGTGMRLFCGFLSSADGHFVLSGDEYLSSRPMQRVVLPLKSIGAYIDGRENGNLAPLCIRGMKLKAFDYTGKIASAQVKSAMILAALKADGECRYTEPELSRDHSERMLRGMGAKLSRDNLTTIINPLSAPLEPLKIHIPSDPSSAFFFAVAAAITPNATVKLENITLNKTRIEAYEILKKMGTSVEYELLEDKYEPIGNIMISYRPLKAVTVEDNISWLIDELPALSIAFACASGVSVIKNARELRVKESDRISTAISGLNACGIKTDETEDGYSVYGGRLKKAVINSHGDHRIAMSFIIAGLKCGMIVDDIECINTSFPNFFKLMQQITRVKIEH